MTEEEFLNSLDAKLAMAQKRAVESGADGASLSVIQEFRALVQQRISGLQTP